jgi:thiamine-monophosphate kinase
MPARPRQNIKLSDVGEFGLIEVIKKQIGESCRAVKGIGDDAAVVPLSAKKYLLLTTDMLLEGVHFTLKMPAAAIGYKALACSISDIAAMGGLPQYAVVSLGVSGSCPRRFVTEMYRGMQRAAQRFHVEIVGGDTVRSKSIIINIALTGIAEKGRVVYRKGARVGDRIFVTGPLGRSLSGGRHLKFIPRVGEAQFLVRHYKPTAMIDISDGLAADLGHILSESRVGAVLEEKLIPRTQGAGSEQALYDGEDFELLFTLPDSKAERLQNLKNANFKFYCIGRIVSGKHGLQIKTMRLGLKKLRVQGYTHF